jgi:phosphatidylinositol alpha-1,6-mannosyltransferase
VYRRFPREDFVIAAGTDPRQEEFDSEHDLRLSRIPLSFTTWGIASARGLGQYLKAAYRIRRLARSGRVERIHCGKCLPEGLIAWLLKLWCGLPYVCYVHGEEMSVATSSRELRCLTRRVLSGAQFVVANSHNTESVLRAEWGLEPASIRLLYPGVDTQLFRPADRDHHERDRLGWGERPVVLTVGRLQKRKGHDVMIRALGRVRAVLPDVLFAVVGDGEERNQLQRLTAAEGLTGHIQFLGALPDWSLVKCYQQCDLFALPNRQVGRDFEGFGMVLLEAQACGKPVLAGASGGTAETMHIGETGVVVPCDAPDTLAAQVTELLADRKRLERMGRAARRWVVENFDWAPLSRQAAELFTDPVARRASPPPQEAIPR